MSCETPLAARCRTFGWTVWLVLGTAISIAVTVSFLQEQERSVTPAYRSAVVNWFAGRPLYNLQGHGFLYLPQAALMFAPWAVLPHLVSELVWRWSLIGVLAWSVAQLTRLQQGDGRWFLVNSIASAVMAYGCARNGQSTLMITGLMILSMVEFSERRWWRATWLLAAAFAFKPLAIVLILLVAALEWRMSWRLALAIGFVAVAPFLTQSPDYVLSQYRACVDNLRVTFHVGETENWAQLFGMLNVAGIAVPESVRTLLRVVAAVGTLGVCWKVTRAMSPQRSAYYLFGMAACYLMLFNSRTEGNTYAMVGPVYGALVAEAAYALRNRLAANLLIAALVVTVLNFELAILVSPRENAIWISPLVCCFVTVYLVSRIRSELREGPPENSTTELLILHAAKLPPVRQQAAAA